MQRYIISDYIISQQVNQFPHLYISLNSNQLLPTKKFSSGKSRVSATQKSYPIVRNKNSCSGILASPFRTCYKKEVLKNLMVTQKNACFT